MVRTGPGLGHPGLFSTSGNDLLNLAKLKKLNPAIAAINDMVELNIGHSIIARSLFVGLANATSEMKQLLQEARS